MNEKQAKRLRNEIRGEYGYSLKRHYRLDQRTGSLHLDPETFEGQYRKWKQIAKAVRRGL